MTQAADQKKQYLAFLQLDQLCLLLTLIPATLKLNRNEAKNIGNSIYSVILSIIILTAFYTKFWSNITIPQNKLNF